MRFFDLVVAVVICGLVRETRGEQPQAVISLIAALPACALPCLASAIQSVGCTLGDMSCTCVVRTGIAEVALPCVLRTCTQAEIASQYHL